VTPRSPFPSVRPLALLAVLPLLWACAASEAPQTSDAAAASADDGVVVPAKPAVDDRAYRYLELDNGLQVLVVSDPATDMAAAALAVDVGSFAEPDDRLGLAHFLEHMLFLGTEKYPDPDEYGEYISRHGGSRNAYTALDHTNYFFSISADELYGGLDRFAQFFVAPLFTAEYVDREKNAVQSEYQLQLRDDGWRTYMTQKRALNPEHPGSRFTIGSLETLADRDDGTTVREELLRFYDAHYSADRMALTILGGEDLDTLEAWARELFAPVPDREVEPETVTEPVLRASDLPSLMRIRPVKERRVLELNFAMPPTDPIYRKDPGSYLANLLGHEGAGSLHALLTERGWIESLSASASRFGEANAILSVNITLSEDGYAQWESVGELVFDYVDLVRREGVAAERYAEQSDLAALSFAYQEKGDAFGYVRRLASNLLVYPPADVIRGPFALDRYDETLIREHLDRVRPENAQVTLIAPDVETDRVEPWFDVPYAIVPLDPTLVSRWQDPAIAADLDLPAPNPFVPEDLELLAQDGGETPRALVREDGFELWHLADTSFDVPRAQVRVELRTPRAGATAEDAVNARLYTRLVTDALNEFAYPARLAGLSWNLGSGGDALTLALGGFDDKLDVLLARVVETMRALEVRPERFEQFRAELLRDLRNTRQNRPFQQAMAELRRMLESPNHDLDALIAAAEAARPEDLEAWMPRALDAPGVVMLAHGNFDADTARTLAGVLREGLALEGTATDTPPERLVRLDAQDVVRREVPVDHTDATLALYVQGRDRSWDERARFGLLGHMMGTPYFNALRTEQQLGYVVTAGAYVRMNTPGLFFLVQSPVAPAAAIETATFEFVDDFRERLADMTPAQFEAERQGLLSLVLEADKRLAERTGRLWGDLDSGLTDFDTREHLAEAIRMRTLDEMRTFLDTFETLAEARRAAVWTAGRFPDGAPTGTPVEDLQAFKAARGAFENVDPRSSATASSASAAAGAD
jgi:secreted Zn-dependent insulinase-like peptidase